MHHHRTCDEILQYVNTQLNPTFRTQEMYAALAHFYGCFIQKKRHSHDTDSLFCNVAIPDVGPNVSLTH